MVGDLREETELKVTPDIIECGQKEIKKVGLINAFFQPIKAKQDAKTRLGIEVPASSNQESSQDLASDVNKANNEVVQEPNTSGSISKKVGPTSKRKTSNLSGKLNHATCTSDQESSHEEPVKPKQLKPKWSVTCAVRNSSKYLNSSGSDFEDDSKGVSNAKTKQTQKSGKKNAKVDQEAMVGLALKNRKEIRQNQQMTRTQKAELFINRNQTQQNLFGSTY
ncbi:hypothetical protein OS493_013157 [Desmophyllum pertusum]|uniref:Uncharacterized protein n=1 Tax=Desmophyllum pertusum TaxID=174260 RepID=A0A9W9YQD6_9CNID|nr:hypothetical protein OS493_013157 [Desmophyllum pertusum]